jgi:hypothetical protein
MGNVLTEADHPDASESRFREVQAPPQWGACFWCKFVFFSCVVNVPNRGDATPQNSNSGMTRDPSICLPPFWLTFVPNLVTDAPIISTVHNRVQPDFQRLTDAVIIVRAQRDLLPLYRASKRDSTLYHLHP